MCVHTLEDLRREHPDIKEEAENMLLHVNDTFREAAGKEREGECVILLLCYTDARLVKKFREDIAHYWEGIALGTGMMLDEYSGDLDDLEALTIWFLDHLDPLSMLLLATTEKIVGEEQLGGMVAQTISMARGAYITRLRLETDGTIN